MQSINGRDIWSFGCVLYECLTGDSMFRGETVTDSIGAILHKQPEWERLPAETPPTIQLLLRRCLAKDRKRRLRDIGDARIELEAAIADPTSSALGLASVAIATESQGTWPSGMATNFAVALLTALIAVGVGWAFWPNPRNDQSSTMNQSASSIELPLRKVALDLMESTIDTRTPPILSPDGKRIVFVGEGGLWIRELQQLAPRKLPSTQSAQSPFWSPSSQEVGFFVRGQLMRVAVAGGAPKPIGNLPEGFRLAGTGAGGAAWLDDGRVLFTTGQRTPTGVWEMPAGGSEPRLVLQPEANEKDFELPSPLPGGLGCLVTVDAEATAISDKICVLTNNGLEEVYRCSG